MEKLKRNGKAKMSKDYQKEVVNFLKPTSVKMNLSEGRSPYPKVEGSLRKLEKAYEDFGDSLKDLYGDMEKHRKSGKGDGQSAVSSRNSVNDMMTECAGFNKTKMAPVLKRWSKVLSKIDDYRG